MYKEYCLYWHFFLLKTLRIQKNATGKGNPSFTQGYLRKSLVSNWREIFFPFLQLVSSTLQCKMSHTRMWPMERSRLPPVQCTSPKKKYQQLWDVLVIIFFTFFLIHTRYSLPLIFFLHFFFLKFDLCIILYFSIISMTCEEIAAFVNETYEREMFM